MPKPPRVVFDTSVLFSYAWKPGRPYALLDALFAGRLAALLCTQTLDELREVALRHIDADRVEYFLKRLTPVMEHAADPPAMFLLQNDPDDSVFFNLAIACSADYLVTYDEAHVLAVREPSHPQNAEIHRLAPKLKIVKPAELALALARAKPPIA